MRSLPIVILYRHKYYKAKVVKVPGIPVEYHLSAVDPPILSDLPVVFVSDPSEDRLKYDPSELNHAIAAAIIDTCQILGEPLHQ